LLVLLVLAGVWTAAAISHREQAQPVTPTASRRTPARTPVDLRRLPQALGRPAVIGGGRGQGAADNRGSA
jgi:hypothetical protein